MCQDVGIDRGVVSAAVSADHRGGHRGVPANGTTPGDPEISQRFVVRGVQAHRAGNEVRDGHDQVGHVVGDRVDLAVALLVAGDFQHLVLDHVAEVERVEDQVQGALEHDLVTDFD